MQFKLEGNIVNEMYNSKPFPVNTILKQYDEKYIWFCSRSFENDGMINYGNGLTWKERQAINQNNDDKHRGTMSPGTEHGW